MSTAEVIVTGLLYVFAVLVIIIMAIYLLSFAVRKFSGMKEALTASAEKRKAAKAAAKAEKDADPLPGQGQPDAPEAGEGGNGALSENSADGELVAAIMAAVTAFEEESGEGRFRVLSFRRVGRGRSAGEK